MWDGGPEETADLGGGLGLTELLLKAAAGFPALREVLKGGGGFGRSFKGSVWMVLEGKTGLPASGGFSLLFFLAGGGGGALGEETILRGWTEEGWCADMVLLL